MIITDAGLETWLLFQQGVDLPAFRGEIAAVLSYIRSDWGNQGAPVTAAGVAAQREATKDQKAAYAGGAALKALAP